MENVGNKHVGAAREKQRESFCRPVTCICRRRGVDKASPCYRDPFEKTWRRTGKGQWLAMSSNDGRIRLSLGIHLYFL